jgi:nucleotide-binding universal stress UspA family protein
MKNILVALDFDGGFDILVSRSTQLAKAFNAKLWLMHIAAPDPDFVGFEVGPQYIRDSRANELREEHRMLQKYTEDLKHSGINAEGLLVQGGTVEMIIEESEKLGIDLIVCGHHDHGFLYKAFIGSVSAQIIKKAKIPVLLVPID